METAMELYKRIHISLKEALFVSESQMEAFFVSE